MRRVLAVAALAVAATAPAASAAEPVVRTAVEPGSVLFGAPVQARLDVVLDTRRFAPAPLSVTTPLGLWIETGPAARSTTRTGALERTRVVLTVACARVECTPEGTATSQRLPAAQVTVRRRDGTLERLRANWPAVVVASRLARGTSTLSPPPFRRETAPPPVRSRVSPSWLAWLLEALAAVLAAAAVWLAADVWRARRRAPSRALPPLERALALARESERRPARDRRRALALLGRVAPDPEAAAAAWSEPEPSPEQIAQLVRRIEERR